jgi:hypothetical protein
MLHQDLILRTIELIEEMHVNSEQSDEEQETQRLKEERTEIGEIILVYRQILRKLGQFRNIGL